LRRSNSISSNITISLADRDKNDEDGMSYSQLQKAQSHLEKQLAEKSYKIGELFNAAFEIGGAPLLDKLQNAIGLIELR
jgi:Ulp1 family protease